MADLTTKAKVKTYLGVTGTTDDDLIDSIIDGVSAMAETFCKRNFLRATYTEYFDTDSGDKKIFLRNTPIISVTSLSYKTGNFGNPTYVAYETNDYLLKNTGIISLSHTMPDAEQFLKAVYVGGYLIDFATEGAVTHTLPADLTQAITEIVAENYQQRASQSVLSETTEGQSVTFRDITLTNKMKQKLAPFVHYNI